MKKTLRLAPNLVLPSNAVTQTLGFIAQKRYGKTYAAGVFAEELHAVGAPFIVLDPIGTWWGLRLAADGKRKGLPVPVFGGLHGDIPLTPESGRLLARILVDLYTSAVIDVSGFRKAERERFVADLAEELFHCAKVKLAPIMLILEEAQKFCPQHSKGKERLVGAIEDIVRLGGNYGIGTSMITQRPQSVNKEVLNQVEALFVGKLNAAHERKAVEAWIVEKGIDETVAALPKMKKGEFYFWSPSWMELFIKIQIARKKTFDSSATPELGKKHKARKLAPVDIAELKGAFAETLKRQAQDDPKLLRRRIADLEKQLQKGGAKVVEKVIEVPVERRVERRVEVAAVGKMEILRLEQVAGQLKDSAEAQSALIHHELQRFEQQMGALTGRIEEKADAVLVGLGKAQAPRVEKQMERRAMPKAGDLRLASGGVAAVRRPPPPPKPRETGLDILGDDGEVKLLAGERSMLTVLTQRHPVKLTRAQLGTLAGLTARGGTFKKYYGTLKKHGFLVAGEAGVEATEEGMTFIGEVPPSPSTTEELQEMWKERLLKGERDMLDALMDEYPEKMTRHALGERVEKTADGGTFKKYLGTLRRNDLVVVEGDWLQASKTLFMEA